MRRQQFRYVKHSKYCLFMQRKPPLQENPKIAIPANIKENLKHGYRHPIYHDSIKVYKGII